MLLRAGTMSGDTAQSGPLHTLTALLNLQARAREAKDTAELGFIAVNETRQLLHYRQAALYLPEAPSDARLQLSGLARTEHNVPYNQWLSSLFAHWRDVAETYLTDGSDLPKKLAEDWSHWLPAHGLLLPLLQTGGAPLGWLLLAREEPWDPAEQAVAQELVKAYAHALALLLATSGRLRRYLRPNRRRRLALWAGLLAGIIALGFVPVPLAVLAPAEVVAKSPFLVRAPIDGVIDHFEVKPNQIVKTGDLLFEFDSTTLRNRRNQASGDLAVTAAKYRQAAQLAVTSDTGRLDMGVRQGEMAAKAAEVRYSEQLLDRGRVRAPRDGVAIFTDSSDWVGTAVSIGETVLEIADPKQIELMIHLPMGDVIPLEPHARIDLFLTISPQTRYQAELEYASYRAEVQPDGTMAYRLKARFLNDPPLRIGLGGTAKLYGEQVPLAYYVFRRPLAVVRQWLGW